MGQLLEVLQNRGILLIDNVRSHQDARTIVKILAGSIPEIIGNVPDCLCDYMKNGNQQIALIHEYSANDVPSILSAVSADRHIVVLRKTISNSALDAAHDQFEQVGIFVRTKEAGYLSETLRWLAEELSRSRS